MLLIFSLWQSKHGGVETQFRGISCWTSKGNPCSSEPSRFAGKTFWVKVRVIGITELVSLSFTVDSASTPASGHHSDLCSCRDSCHSRNSDPCHIQRVLSQCCEIMVAAAALAAPSRPSLHVGREHRLCSCWLPRCSMRSKVITCCITVLV